MKKDFYKQLHKEAREFRHNKIKEVFSNKVITKNELYFTNRWAEMFKEEI